jgi:hypothetical protein
MLRFMFVIYLTTLLETEPLNGTMAAAFQIVFQFIDSHLQIFYWFPM